MSKFILSVGLIGLCHAAYSATQHRSYLRLTEKESSKLPLDIFLQTVICLLISCFSILKIVAKFKSIKISSDWETKTWDQIGNRQSFWSFNHRGKYLHLNYQDEDEEEKIDQLMRNAGIETIDDNEVEKLRQQLDRELKEKQQKKEELNLRYQQRQQQQQQEKIENINSNERSSGHKDSDTDTETESDEESVDEGNN